MANLLDTIFPRSCSICKRKGDYLCDHCKKLFKRSIPECYICRKISPNYKTHYECKEERKNSSLDHVFVAWEYNSLSSILLKKYKYNYVQSISNTLIEIFIESIKNSTFDINLPGSILTNVPLAENRLRERGFNQTTEIAKKVAEAFNLLFVEDLVKRKEGYGHQALRDKEERKGIKEGTFTLKNNFYLEEYSSITILDDVITTGATLEAIASTLRKNTDKDIEINALCLFRGRPYYLGSPKSGLTVSSSPNPSKPSSPSVPSRSKSSGGFTSPASTSSRAVTISW
jgi:ComF family protein